MTNHSNNYLTLSGLWCFSILCTKSSLLHLLLHLWILNNSFQKLLCLCFVFTLNISWTFIHPPQRPFTRRLRLEKKKQRLAFSSLTSSFPKSHTLSQFGFHQNEHLLLCLPFKWIKGNSKPFCLRKYRIPCQPDMRPFLSSDLLNLP